MSTSAVFRVCSKPLKTAEAVSILENVSKESCTNLPPVKPKGGEMYIYFNEQSDKLKDDDWNCDQYRWSNQGVKELPKTQPQVKKSYFHLETPNGITTQFTKHAYKLIASSNNAVLIHYLGDESCATDFPHGNSANSSRAYIRTCPSVIKSLQQSCKYETPTTVYRKHVTNVPSPTHLAVLQPRNVRQVKNIRSKQQQKQRLSHDSLYNLHEIALDLPDFIHLIHTYPDLVCVCGTKQLFDEFDRVLLLQSSVPQLLAYDTTFELGDFYLSTLTFRHTLFKEAPVIPAAFLIHERKLITCHEQLFNVCSKLVPSLKTTNKPIVTDEEQAYVNVVGKYLQAAPHLRCWNHVVRDAQRWLQRHGAPSDDVTVYLSDMKELFHLCTEKEYSEQLSEMAKKWSAPFFEYYSNNIHCDINSVARWAVEPYGVYCPYSGVTNNQAEGINFVIKHLQEWKEAPLDCMVLALHYLQDYYSVEIARGQQGLGNYHLVSEFSASVAMPLFLPKSTVYSPSEIIAKIKENLCQESNDTSNITEATSTIINPNPTSQNLSQQERAKRVLEENKISFDMKLHTFTVMGSTCPRVVTLFPKETCSCPSTTQCYHILAAKMALGQKDDHEKRKVNLTQLRKNSRSRNSKKSGRKRPRPEDCDVTAAPDAIVNPKMKKSDSESELLANNSKAVDHQSLPKDEYCDQISDQEMLNLWKKLSPFYKVDTEDDSYETIERKEDEILMFLTIDIFMWLQYRKFQGLPDLKQEGDFIIATRSDRHHFESFRDLPFNSKNPLPSCSLLLKYTQIKNIPVTVIKEFDCEYVVGFPISEIDELCEWAQTEINSKQQDDIYSTLQKPSSKNTCETDKMPCRNTAAQQAIFNKRQLGLKIGHEDPIILDDNDQLSREVSKANPKLEMEKILLNDTAWLTCTIIDEAQQLLKSMTHTSGFQSVAVGRTMQFEIQDHEFIQILHCNTGHWLTISTIGSENSEVFVYDSLYSSASECVQFQISSLLATPLNEITLNFVDVQMQSGTYDCGLFAVAFATMLTLGHNPGQFFFDQRAMRRHLWTCLKNKKMLMFPVIKERRNKQKIKATQQIPIFCLCRLPAMTGIQMIECTNCKVWYHTEVCVKVDEKYFSKDESWNCPNCSSLILP